MSIDSLTSFLGWMAFINLGLMLTTLLGILRMKKQAVAIHRRLFGLNSQDLSRAYFAYLAQYKLLVLVFNIVPYLALRILN